MGPTRPFYLFFFSYARMDRDRYLERFFQDLHTTVAQKAGTEEASYRDLLNIAPGDDWPEELSTALQSSQTLVCLYSPAYFQRDFCGKEFQVFLERQGVALDGSGVARGSRRIIPVLWRKQADLERLGLPPATVRAIQYLVSARRQAEYAERGLFALLRLGKKTSYYEIVEEIADQVMDRSRPELPPLPEPLDIGKVRNAFENVPSAAPGGPGVLRVLYLATSDTALQAARPFTDPAPPTLRSLLGDAALRLGVQVAEQRLDPLHPDLSGEMETAVQQCAARNELVLVIATPDALAAGVHPLLHHVANVGGTRGVGVLAMGPAGDEPGTDGYAPSTVTSQAAPARIRWFVGSASDFVTLLSGTVCDLLGQVLVAGRVHRQVGVTGPERRPMVAGPRATAEA